MVFFGLIPGFLFFIGLASLAFFIDNCSGSSYQRNIQSGLPIFESKTQPYIFLVADLFAHIPCSFYSGIYFYRYFSK